MNVQAMFDRIAPGYDRANRVMSMGVDTLWRRRALTWLPASGEILDLCAGTLDFSLALSEHPVVALDFSARMLETGRARLPEGARVELVQGDAQELPFTAGRFSGAVCGFGLRNVPDNRRALAEVHRVLAPGARFVVLEFFRPRSLLARVFHRVYNRLVLPLVGGLITGDRDAYRYLAASMEGYLPRTDFESLARSVGFEVRAGRELFPPVASLVVLERS